MRGARIAHELHRNALLLERDEPEIRVPHWRPEVFLALNDERWRLHLRYFANRRQRVVHREVVPRLSVELELREPLRVGRAVPVRPLADHAIGLSGLEAIRLRGDPRGHEAAV